MDESDANERVKSDESVNVFLYSVESNLIVSSDQETFKSDDQRHLVHEQFIRTLSFEDPAKQTGYVGSRELDWSRDTPISNSKLSFINTEKDHNISKEQARAELQKIDNSKLFKNKMLMMQQYEK